MRNEGRGAREKAKAKGGKEDEDLVDMRKEANKDEEEEDQIKVWLREGRGTRSKEEGQEQGGWRDDGRG